MIETIHLLPPDAGLRSNPLLFGIAEALAQLLPVAAQAPSPCEGQAESVGDSGGVAPVQAESRSP